MGSGAVDTRRIYRSSPSVLTRRDGDGLMAYSPGNIAVHTMNATMAAVFERCDGAHTCEQIAADLVERHAIAIDDAARATYDALAALIEHGLIEPA